MGNLITLPGIFLTWHGNWAPELSIKLEPQQQQELVLKLQAYLRDELDVEMGTFDVQFLLEFFTEQAATVFYNQGLADARQALQTKIDEFAEVIYELEQRPPR